MINRELASIFEEMGDIEEIEGNRWESIAYRRVALSIGTLSEDIKEIYKRGELRKIDGVGKAIELKIIEFIENGKISKHEEMKKKYPVDFTTLGKIQGLGPKRIAVLYRELNVRNIDDLKKAAEDDEISKLSGFGEKSQESIKKNIDTFLKTGSSRLVLGYYYDQFYSILEKLKANRHFIRADIAGSVRRMKDTIGDLDILAVCDNPSECVKYFLSLDEVGSTIVSGETKVSVQLDIGINCDLRMVPLESYGAALQYFTGSKEHNIRTRDIAISKGMKLNEYGLFRDDTMVAGDSEEEVYKELGLEWVPPELRENMGEIEASASRKMPTLLKNEDVLGDFHTHTDESDGRSTLEEMINAARGLGYKFIVISDHSVSLKIANGLDEKRFRKQFNDIDEMNEKYEDIKILKGVELEILKDGSLDLPDTLLAEMDFVIGGLHQNISDDIKSNTDRFIKAIRSGLISTIAHPTGRLIGTREPYRIDFPRVFAACEENKVAIEINGFPERSDLPFDLVKKASGYKVDFSLGSDSHSTEHLKYLRFAVAVARRGWLAKDRVLNCMEIDKVLKRVRV